MQLNALLRLAFATATPHGLTLLHRVTRRLIMQKAHGYTVQLLVTQQHSIVLPLLVSIWFQVLFHSPHRSPFHLSLTVLVHYRSPVSI
jgi:hypothetical protein